MTATALKPIPLLDLAALHAPIQDEIMREISRVVESQSFILGRDVQELETAIAAYCGTRYAVGCANGTDALFLALLAAGIGPGDVVLTTPYSFFATAGAITRTGATPRFVDIDSATFNIDAQAAADAIETDARIRAVIPVHLFGGCADMDPILEAAERRGVIVIEDGAQSIGAAYKGRPAQSMGDMATISFFPSKNLGAFGDAGMVLTNDSQLSERLAMLRVHGSKNKYRHETVGINSRLDTLQAAVLRVKLRYLDGWTEGRQRNAAAYRELLSGLEAVRLPVPAPHQTRHIYNQFVIRCERRDELKAYLSENGVGTEIYYPIPLHLQPCYRGLGLPEGSFPEAERAARESLALPVHSALSTDDLERITSLIRQFYSTR